MTHDYVNAIPNQSCRYETLAPVRVFSCKKPLESVIRRTLVAETHLTVQLPSVRPSPILHVPTHLRFPYDILC